MLRSRLRPRRPPSLLRATWIARAAVAAATAAAAGCGGAQAQGPGASASPPGTSTVAPGPPIDFAFDSLDGRPVNAQASRGKPTFITFVTTDNLPSQAEVDFLVAMAKNDGDKINYYVVAVAAPADRELAQLYAKWLSPTLPVAVIDPAVATTVQGFGDVTQVPVTFLLDVRGRVVWSALGRVARSEEMRGALRALP